MMASVIGIRRRQRRSGTTRRDLEGVTGPRLVVPLSNDRIEGPLPVDWPEETPQRGHGPQGIRMAREPHEQRGPSEEASAL